MNNIILLIVPSDSKDFKVRSDASFERDYLAGVYGGIPWLKEFSMRG